MVENSQESLQSRKENVAYVAQILVEQAICAEVKYKYTTQNYNVSRFWNSILVSQAKGGLIYFITNYQNPTLHISERFLDTENEHIKVREALQLAQYCHKENATNMVKNLYGCGCKAEK